jgi:signal transduction histidine kinase
MKDSSKVDSQDHILVVDDTPDNLLLIKAMLAPRGYRLSLVNSGEKALDLILPKGGNTQVAPPDLVLVDVMMPGIDGYAVTQRIRENPKLPFIPILLITAHDQASVVKGLDLGADDFIRKPVSMEELLARVQSLLRLKHSVDERDAIARQREDFVSRLTHDLRTPLLAADRMLNLMQQGVLGEMTPGLHQATSTMIRSNQNLLTMVNTLLEVSRHDAGEKNLYFATVDIQEILREVLEELQPLVMDKPVALDYQPLPSSPRVVGDRLELHRVFTNLIGNAIKFTDTGKITVSLQLTDDYLNIAVKDTGVGISPEHQTIIFNRFRTGNHRAAGSGLGLHLCKRILDAHQGKISLTSTPGEGSVFVVSLPLTAQASPPTLEP